MKLFNYKIQIAILIGLCLLDMSGVAYLVQWREHFWDAVSNKHYDVFLHLIVIFTAVALSLCAIGGLETYTQNKIALNWRRVLTRKVLKLEPVKFCVEGISQRGQEDCRDYPLLFMDLIRQIGMQSIMIIYFIVVIMQNTAYLFILIPIVYSIISTGISYWIAHPLIKLNYVNQVLEAAFRQSLSKLDYGRVHRNNHKMFTKTKHLNYFQYFYGQISVIFPYIILAPMYFSGAIIFGVFMQVASTISHLTDALGIILGNFDKINKYLSCRKRLKELGVI